MEDTSRIRLFIEDESFVVKVPRGDESVEKPYRDAEKKVKQIMNDYRGRYKEAGAEISQKRLLAMTALHLAKETVHAEALSDDSQVLQLIGRLDGELETFLAE